MPTFQAIAGKANVALNSANIQNFPKTELKLDQPFSDVGFKALGLTDAEIAYIRSWPESLRATIRAVIHSAINRDTPLPVTVAWQPGYDFQVTVSEAPGTSASPGGITILARSRYPADTHPGTL